MFDPLTALNTPNSALFWGRQSWLDQACTHALAQDYFEVLFTNENGALTEGAITNLFIRTESGWKTPPVTDGLLPGTWREEVIEETGAEEASLTPEDLRAARKLLVGNSVRGEFGIEEVVDAEGEVLYSR
ncbi:MAG: aminotransferase class IV [Armatimonadia bacterium]